MNDWSIALCLALACLAGAEVAAQTYGVDDPIPPGAKGAVLTFSGVVTAIQGLSSGVLGRTESLAAALSDLGATATETEIHIQMSADVLFDFDKADLKPAAAPSLEKVVTVLGSYPAAHVAIDGYTDAKGSDSYNQKLSDRRAESVRIWLAARPGLGGLTFVTHGYGAKDPVAPNTKPNGSDNPEGRQKNRRVEIIVKK